MTADLDRRMARDKGRSNPLRIYTANLSGSEPCGFLFGGNIMTQKGISTTGIGAQEFAATRPNIGRAILGGFVGTPAMSSLMYTAAPLMGVRVDIADVLGRALGGWALGMIAHMINGSLLFPLLYVLIADRLPVGPPVGKGFAFGGCLWLASQFIVMPTMGAGALSSHLGPMASVASLLGHLLYGALLGSLAGDAEKVPVSAAYAPLAQGGLHEEESTRVSHS
jgi:uncharacterized protein DUF6789